jgi:hypothetical protein
VSVGEREVAVSGRGVWLIAGVFVAGKGVKVGRIGVLVGAGVIVGGGGATAPPNNRGLGKPVP